MSRRRRIQDNDGGDRISDLPELVIGHILSLMPTKDAVRTSVLSKSWEYKWTSSHAIDIDYQVCHKQQKQKFFRKRITWIIFENFVDRVVHLSRNVTSFCLKLSKSIGYDTDRVAGWICAVSMGDVESLIVNSVPKYSDSEVLLPRNLLRNTSLRNLDLKLPSTFELPARISCPNLKNLILYKVKIVRNSSSRDTLALSFPILETFTLDMCSLLNVKMVEVHAPSLTTFYRTVPHINDPELFDYSIKIISTRLVEFRFRGQVLEKFILIGQQVVNATLLCYGLSGETIKHAQTLLNEVSNLKELNISSALIKSTGEISLPVLHHLVQLTLSCNGDLFTTEGLLRFLQATPFLKFLKINMSYLGDNEDYDCNAVVNVPHCIEEQLQEIALEAFQDKSQQVNLVKFLLKNGRALKKVHICCSHGSKEEKRSISTQLSNFHTCSTSLILVVE